jgi:hypothetical protein
VIVDTARSAVWVHGESTPERITYVPQLAKPEQRTHAQSGQGAPAANGKAALTIAAEIQASE